MSGSERATAWRDAMCGEVTEEWVDRTPRLAGWVHRVRDLGGVMFVDLRDRSGLVQLACGPEWSSPETMTACRSLSGFSQFAQPPFGLLA